MQWFSKGLEQLLQYYIILVNSNEYKLISQYQSGSVLYDTWLFGKNFT